MRILIVDGEQRSALATVRSLGRAGHHVEVASARPRSLGGASRFSRREHLLPRPDSGVSAYGAAVASVVGSGGMDLVVPVTDASLVALMERQRVDPDLPLPPPGHGAYSAASDKLGLTALAGDVGVPVPDQVVVRRRDDDVLPEAVEHVGWPLVVKPHRSVIPAGDSLVRTEVRLAADAVELRHILQSQPREAFPLLLQRRVQGPGLGAFVLARDGAPLALFGHRRLREKPPTGGVSVYRESVELREDVRGYVTSLVRALGWNGVAMVEFKEDASTGVPYLMEINARFWGSLQLAVDAGVDFPALLVDAFFGSAPFPEPVGYEPGIRSRWLWGDVDHLLWILRAPRRYRQVHPELPSRLGAALRFMLPWRPGDRWEVLRPTDPRPFLRESARWIQDLGDRS